MLGSRNQSSDQNNLPALFRTLRDATPFVRAAAVTGLRAVGEPAVPGLIVELTTSDLGFVRASAAQLLGEIPIESPELAAQVVDALAAALADEDEETRAHAAESLRAINTPQAQAVLGS